MGASESVMLVLVDPVRNSNKFYAVNLDEDGTVRTEYGRVGEPGKCGVSGHGRRTFERIVAGKKRKGYVPASVAHSSTERAAKRAHTDLAGDSTDQRLTALIDRIVKQNAHEIRDLSGGRLTVAKGQVSTPLGLLSLSALDEAERVLDALAVTPSDTRLLARYLTLVPQSVGRGRDWTDRFFSGARTVDQQRAFIDQLRQSVQFSQAASDFESDDRVFAYRLRPVDDKKVLNRITRTFTGSLNPTHPSAGMRLVNVYEVSAPDAETTFDEAAERVGNVRPMWHGTRAFNVLSILAGGLRVSSRGASNVTGRMFGDGLYFSEQSTKSLNYSRGGIWSSGRDTRALMFLADVAMGWEYRPNLHGARSYNDVLNGKVADKNGKVFNSINVKAGAAGVRNHEAIVPGPGQVALRYLCEFE